MGDKKSPFYRVVVADSRSPRDGKFIEVLGTYDPLKSPAVIKINAEKAVKWLSNGAQPTDTAKSLLITAGVIPAPKQRPPAKLSYKKAEVPVVEAKPEVKKEEAKSEEKVEAKTEEKIAEPVVEAAVEPVAEEKAEEAAVPAEDTVAVPVEEKTEG